MFRLQRTAAAACLLLAVLACGQRSDAELIAAAQALLDKRQFSAAVIEFKNALNQNPQSAAARLLLGKALLQSGDAAAALIELQKAQAAKAPAAEVVPEIARALLAAGEGDKLVAQYADATFGQPHADADLQTSLAGAHAAGGRLEAARAAASAALRAQPGHGAAVVLLARLDATAGDMAGALRQLDQVLARDPGHAGAGLLKGEILLRAGNQPDAALQALRQVRNAHPQLIAAQVAVVNALSLQNKTAEARNEFAQLQKIGPQHPDTQFLQAQFAFIDKDYKASREITERLLAKAPNNLRVLLLAAAAEAELKQHTLAEGLLGRALKLAPTQPLVRHLLAQTYLGTGAPDKAIEALQPLIDTPKADATSLGLAGEAYLQAGDARRSEAAFQRALKAAPDDARLRTSVAVAQMARGETGAAIGQLEAIAKGDNSPRADLALLSARLRQNDLNGALTVVDTLHKKLPDLAYPLTLRGRVLGQMGDNAGAAASFEAALAKEPAHFAATAGLAALDLDAGQHEQARQRFERLIKADPRHVRARLALAELDTRLGVPAVVVAVQLKEAARIDPMQVAPQLALIERLLASGDAQAAQGAAQDAAARLPNDLAILDALGRAQVAVGDSQRAVSTFKRLAALQPRQARPQVQLADAYLAGNDAASAAAALRQALRIEPENPLAQRGLALLAMKDKRPQDGLAVARAMQQRRPKDAAGFALEGELQGSASNWAGAATAYAVALRLGPSTDLAIKLHRSLMQGAKAAEAERVVTDWTTRHPKDAAFIHYLADRASAANDWPQAEARYRAVLALQPRHALVMNNLAWLLATQHKPGAVVMAEQASALLPERASLLDTLALAQASEGRLPKAVQTQQRAVELDPKDPMLRLRLAQLLLKNGDKSEARNTLEPVSRLGARFAGQAEVAALLKGL